MHFLLKKVIRKIDYVQVFLKPFLLLFQCRCQRPRQPTIPSTQTNLQRNRTLRTEIEENNPLWNKKLIVNTLYIRNY